MPPKCTWNDDDDDNDVISRIFYRSCRNTVVLMEQPCNNSIVLRKIESRRHLNVQAIFPATENTQAFRSLAFWLTKRSSCKPTNRMNLNEFKLLQWNYDEYIVFYELKLHTRKSHLFHLIWAHSLSLPLSLSASAVQRNQKQMKKNTLIIRQRFVFTPLIHMKPSKMQRHSTRLDTQHWIDERQEIHAIMEFQHIIFAKFFAWHFDLNFEESLQFYWHNCLNFESFLFSCSYFYTLHPLACFYGSCS